MFVFGFRKNFFPSFVAIEPLFFPFIFVFWGGLVDYFGDMLGEVFSGKIIFYFDVGEGEECGDKKKEDDKG